MDGCMAARARMKCLEGYLHILKKFLWKKSQICAKPMASHKCWYMLRRTGIVVLEQNALMLLWNIHLLCFVDAVLLYNLFSWLMYWNLSNSTIGWPSQPGNSGLGWEKATKYLDILDNSVCCGWQYYTVTALVCFTSIVLAMPVHNL